MRRLAAASLLPACVLYEEPPPPPPDPLPAYQLVPRGSISTFGEVVGVAWDGQQHWIVTFEEIGDWTVPDRIEVFAFDVETGARSSELVLTNHTDRPMGATWLDGELWINYTLTGNVVSLDPATGVEIPRIRVGASIFEIDSDGTWLYAADSSIAGGVEVYDKVSGTVVDVRHTDEWEFALRGVAVVQPPGAGEYEVWGGTLATNVVPVMVGNEVVARATFDGFGNNMAAQFVFAGQRLTMEMNNQLFFFDVVRP